MIRRFARMLFADLRGSRFSGDDASPGWERMLLLRSIRQVALVFAAAWQAVIALAAIGSIGVASWPIVLAAGLVALLALSALAYQWIAPFVPATMALVALGSYAASGDLESALVFAGCWQMNFASCIAGLIVLGRAVLPYVAAMGAGLAGGIIWLLPGWGVQFPAIVLVTQLTIVIALKWGMARLLRSADSADGAAAAATAARRRERLSEHVSAQMAEESRVLHDTAINTLGAIANGRAGIADAERVRAQCARDVTLLHTLRTQPSLMAPAQLDEIFRQPGLPAVRAGIDDDGLARCAQLLSSAVTTAIVRCVGEAVTNAAKHSGADHVVVAVDATDTELTVVVRDHGVGFAPDALSTGFGIGASLIARAEDNGFTAVVAGEPGIGTTVTLTVPLVAVVADFDLGPSDWQPDDALHVRAGELWGIGVAVVSAVLAVAGSQNNHFALVPMIAVMVIVWIAFRTFVHARGRAWFLVMLATSTLGVFLLSAAATSFGTEGAVHWHALAATGPFVLLLSATSSRGAQICAMTSWVGLAVIIAVLTVRDSVSAAEIVLVAAAVGVGFSLLWATFQIMLRRVGEQLVRSRNEIVRAGIRAELDISTRAGYRRWVSAGLDSAILLLQDIADGVRDPQLADTRRACADEERYLRQIVQISPEFVNLSRELLQTLSRARGRRVTYHLRLGDVDAPDASTAHRIATAIGDAMEALTPGDVLRASLFPVSDGLRLTLLGPGIGSTGGLDDARYEDLGVTELIEVTFPHRAEEVRAA